MLTTIITTLKWIVGTDPRDIMHFVIKLAVIAMVAYGIHLESEVKDLKYKLSTLQPLAERQSAMLQSCSEHTEELVSAEKEKTRLAILMVDQAKKDAKSEHDRADDLAHRKPKEIVVTKETAVNYGGSDNETKNGDYLSTHDLANEEIDLRAKK